MIENKQLAVFAFVDAFGWRIFNEHSFLDGRLQTATPLQSILGYSCACDPTIISGALPEKHGHFSFFCFDPEASPFRACRYLNCLPEWLTRRGRVRRQISKWLQRRLGYTGYFQIYNVPFSRLPYFDYSEKRDIYQSGGLNGGTFTIFDYLRDHEIPFCLSDWRRSEIDNLFELNRRVSEGEIRFAYLYLAELDGVMHAEGTRSARVSDKIAWYDKQFRRLLDHAEAEYDEVRLYLFSDHGMTDVVESVDLVRTIEGLGLRFGVDYGAMYDSTMARFWFLNDMAEQRIRSALEEDGHGRSLTDRELREFGAYFPSRRYGDLIYLLQPGSLIVPSYMNSTQLPGMHGYDPSHDDSHALLASTEDLPDPPRRLDDLHGLMRYEADRCLGATSYLESGVAPVGAS